MPTPIEWCDETFNPWWGCERVSPACAHCYADTFAIRLGMDLWDDKRKDGSLAPHGFRFFGDKHWDEPLKWARTLPGKLGRRPRVFCASMADVFEERDELHEPRVRLFSLIAATPQLDWLILTKRPEFARDWLPDGGGFVFPNVWMGVSIENARYTWRADVLRQIPAAVRFISAEPLLGSLYDGRSDVSAPRDRTQGRLELEAQPAQVDDLDPADVGLLRDREDPRQRVRVRDDLLRLGGAERLDTAESVRGRDLPTREDASRHHPRVGRAPLDLSGIDWVIAGAESGHRARPMNHDHVREIRDACIANGTAFFYKQDAVKGKKIGLPELDGRQWTEMPRCA